jgi:hypothetical protein
MITSDNEAAALLPDSVSQRPAITFDDSAGIGTIVKWDKTSSFPFLFIEKNRQHEAAFRENMMHGLKEGKPEVAEPFHHDWVIIIVLISAFFYASLPSYSRKLFPGATRFFLFRGIGDPEARETSELFHWQSTLFNLVTFVNLALFAYYAVIYHDLSSGSLPEYVLWLITLAIVIAAVTTRHISCILTGHLSGQREVFNEYIITIYQSYRYMGFGSILLVSLISYTGILTPEIFFITGYILFGVLYLMRIARLMLIFLKGRFSILYWILYLCALEILPLAVLIKLASSII